MEPPSGVEGENTPPCTPQETLGERTPLGSLVVVVMEVVGEMVVVVAHLRHRWCATFAAASI